MCQRCDREVIEMGILESDLPGLPFKPVKWVCMVEGCSCYTGLRDYGIFPYYFWPVKVKRSKDSWRGGWTEYTHGYICSKHFPEYKKSPMAFMRKHGTSLKHFKERIIHITKSKLYKK